MRDVLPPVPAGAFSAKIQLRSILVDEGWPEEAKFGFGQLIRRCNLRSGKPPAYRFEGRICGWYIDSKGQIGYAVNSLAIPGCTQIYPEAGLEALP